MNSAKDDPEEPGFPIRKSTDQRVLAPPRSLSQRATSFIASVRQGIHQMPLKRLIQRNLVTSRDQFSDFAKGKAANLVSRFAKGKELGRASCRERVCQYV